MGGTTIYFRLGGELRSCSVAEFGWRLGLYTSEEVDGAFLLNLLHGETQRNEMRCVTFWPTIGNGAYTSTTGAASIRDPIVRLVHRCITYSLSARQGTTHRITASDLFYLYTIFSEDVYCNIPFWVASYLRTSVGERDFDKVYGGMFVTRLARSYGLLTPQIIGYLSDCGKCRIARAKSLRQMSIVMQMGDGTYIWYIGVNDGDDDGDDEEVPQQHQFAGYEEGTADYYRHMGRGDWQAHQGAWMGQVDAWRATTDQRFDWMYDHTVRQMQHLSTRDHIEPHLQIDPFPGREQDYPPFGYTGHLPPGYDYRFGPSPQ